MIIILYIRTRSSLHCRMPRHSSFLIPSSSSSSSSQQRPEEAAAAGATPDEYFVQQAKLYRHLEKRLNKFNKKAANERRGLNRNRRHSKSIKPTFSNPSNAQTSPPISSSTPSDTFTSNMISSSIRVSGRSLAQVIVSVKWQLIYIKINPQIAPCCRFCFILDHRYCRSACSKETKQEEGS